VVNFSPPSTHNPIGAGIFLHGWNSSGHTAGCIALQPGQLFAVMSWTSQARAPHLTMGTDAEMQGL